MGIWKRESWKVQERKLIIETQMEVQNLYFHVLQAGNTKGIHGLTGDTSFEQCRPQPWPIGKMKQEIVNPCGDIFAKSSGVG